MLGSRFGLGVALLRRGRGRREICRCINICDYYTGFGCCWWMGWYICSVSDEMMGTHTRRINNIG